MGIIAKYKFNQTIHENYLPIFNSGFTDYTITDEIDTDGFTVRTIESNSLPTLIRFGDSSDDYESIGVLSLLKIDYVNIHNGIKTFDNFLANARNLISVNTNGWNTSNITNMHCMFYNCFSLTFLDVSNFKTENVRVADGMFNNCSSLISLDLSNFNTSNVTNMNSMFNACSSLISLDLSNFNTNKVTTMNSMFNNCSSLTSLDVSSFDTSQVINIAGMFQGCSSLTSLDVSNFDTGNVTGMGYMFNRCSSLTSLDVSSFDTNKTTDMSYMFQNCSLLTSLDASNFNTENVTTMQSMFQNCSSLTSLDVSNFNTGNVANINSMFQDCSSLTSLDVSNFNTGNVTNMYAMFHNCTSLTSLDLSNFNTSQVTNMSGVFYGCSLLTSIDVSNFNTENATVTSWMFYNCSSLTSLDISNFNTSQVTDMSGMFYNCSSLTSLDVSGFNINKVNYMQNMFQNCSSLTSLDVSGFNINKVIYMQSMFQDCSSLISLDLSNFNTENVTNVVGMFADCSSLTSLDISNFNTEKITNMQGMFQNCSSLTSLDISNFNTKNVTNMQGMFYNCSSLTSLDISNFNTEKVTNMQAMFQNCSALTSLDISNFNTEKVTNISWMFNDCKLLTNIGTIYCNSSTINKISSLITTNTKIYYSLPDISELESHDNIEYIKYVFPTKIQLPPHIQLHKLPDGTCDELDIKTGILTRKINKKILNGDVSIFTTLLDQQTEDTLLFMMKIDDMLIQNIKQDSVMCTRFPVNNKNVYSANYEFLTPNEGLDAKIAIRIFKKRLSSYDVNGFRKWLSENPVELYYRLANPVVEKLILNYNNSCNYGVILPRGTSDNYNVITNEYKQNLDFIPIDGSIAFDTATIKDTTVKYSIAISKFEVDTTNVRGSDGIYCDNNLFKYEASDNDYEHAYIENDTTLHVYVNKSRLSSYDQVGFQLYLTNNPFDLYYAMRNTIISYVNYEDLDPEKASWEMLDCTEDGSITIESGNMDKTLLLDCMDYVAPTKNRFEIDLLKANTQYTVYAEGISGRVQLNFGGNIVNFTSGNIYTSGETQLVEFYTDNEIKNLIIIEGDTRNETIEFFEGLKSSENITVISSNASYVFGKGGKIQ